jgi:hypothetical protein
VIGVAIAGANENEMLPLEVSSGGGGGGEIAGCETGGTIGTFISDGLTASGLVGLGGGGGWTGVGGGVITTGLSTSSGGGSGGVTGVWGGGNDGGNPITGNPNSLFSSGGGVLVCGPIIGTGNPIVGFCCWLGEEGCGPIPVPPLLFPMIDAMLETVAPSGISPPRFSSTPLPRMPPLTG